MKLNIVKHRKIWYAFSTVLVLASLFALVGFGLKPGIDFTGGTLLEVSIESKPVHAKIQEVLVASGHDEAVVQVSNESVLVRTEPITEEQHQKLLASFESAFGKTTELRFDSIGPVIGNE